MMKAAPVIVALLLLPAPAAAWAAPAYAPLSGLQCDARTITCATHLDTTTRQGTMIVRFDNLDGKGKQAFGICALTIAKVEKP